MGQILQISVPSPAVQHSPIGIALPTGNSKYHILDFRSKNDVLADYPGSSKKVLRH